MRVATFVVVLLVHVLFLLAFTQLRQSGPQLVEYRVAAEAFFVDPVLTTGPEPKKSVERPSRASARRSAATTLPAPSASVQPESQPESTAITAPTTAPDWRNELQITANNQLARQQYQHQHPSPLAPHDFPGVTPGEAHKSQFGWNHAATHRVEELPTGGLLININDRCVIVWAILPFMGCRIGKIPARGDLFEHLKDAPEPQP
jgi:hypothetical protein